MHPKERESIFIPDDVQNLIAKAVQEKIASRPDPFLTTTVLRFLATTNQDDELAQKLNISPDQAHDELNYLAGANLIDHTTYFPNAAGVAYAFHPVSFATPGTLSWKEIIDYEHQPPRDIIKVVQTASPHITNFFTTHTHGAYGKVFAVERKSHELVAQRRKEEQEELRAALKLGPNSQVNVSFLTEVKGELEGPSHWPVGNVSIETMHETILDALKERESAMAYVKTEQREGIEPQAFGQLYVGKQRKHHRLVGYHAHLHIGLNRESTLWTAPLEYQRKGFEARAALFRALDSIDLRTVQKEYTF